jgi:hypothetical protein
MAIHISKIDRVARAIGYVTIFWAWLDRSLDEFLKALIPLEDGDIERIVTANMNMRAKIQIIKAIAIIRRFDDKWLNSLNIQLDYTDNDLRIRRNRIVHDSWAKSGRSLQLVSKRTKIRRSRNP